MKARIFKSCTKSVFLVMIFFSRHFMAQDSALILRGGICVNKMAGFYTMGGLSAEINSPKILKGKVDLGLHVSTSYAGAAIATHAIPVYAAEVFVQKCFRLKTRFRPLVALNAGYAKAFYGNRIFDQIPQQSILISPEAGLRYAFRSPFIINLSLGYNLISGNGIKGPGFIYPVFFRLRALYIFRRGK